MSWDAVAAFIALALAILTVVKTYIIHEYRMNGLEERVKRMERIQMMIVSHLVRQHLITPEQVAELECKEH